MTEQQYITERLENQRKYYSERSQRNKKWYFRLRVATIVLAASLPLLTGFADRFSYFSMLAGIAGALIAVLEGLQNLFQFREKWTEYRLAAENLERERLLYETQSGAYRADNSLQLLVERIEALTNQENTHWQHIFSKEEKHNV